MGDDADRRSRGGEPGWPIDEADEVFRRENVDVRLGEDRLVSAVFKEGRLGKGGGGMSETLHAGVDDREGPADDGGRRETTSAERDWREGELRMLMDRGGEELDGAAAAAAASVNVFEREGGVVEEEDGIGGGGPDGLPVISPNVAPDVAVDFGVFQPAISASETSSVVPMGSEASAGIRSLKRSEASLARRISRSLRESEGILDVSSALSRSKSSLTTSAVGSRKYCSRACAMRGCGERTVRSKARKECWVSSRHAP
jgi:hypothetical protein